MTMTAAQLRCYV